jgi:hypothetical protein
VVKDLLQTYDSVPVAEVPKKTPTPNEPSSTPEVTIRMGPVSWRQNVSSATAGTYTLPLTQIIGLVSLFQTPRIHGNRAMTKDKVV